MNLLDLFIKIGVDDEASDKIDKISSSVGKKLKTAATVGITAVTAVATAVTAVSVAFARAANSVAEYGDNIEDTAQQMGLSFQGFQEWSFILQRSGTSIESLKASMKTLATAAQTNNKAFSKLGITQEKLANLNQEEIFALTIESLQQVEDETERTYLAGQLLGRGATELGAVLNMTADETNDLRKELHRIGGVMSDEAIKASAQFQDSLLNLKTALASVKRESIENFLPSINKIIDGLTEVFAGNENGFTVISEGLNEFAKNIGETLPDIARGVTRLVEGLIDSIDSDVLVKAVTDAVFIIVNSILNYLPNIVQLGIDIISALADGISDNVDELIPAVVNAILQIIDVLLQPKNISALVKAGNNLVAAIIVGVIKALPEIISSVSEILFGSVTDIVDSFGEEFTNSENKGIFEGAGKTLGESFVIGFLNYAKNFLKSPLSSIIESFMEDSQAEKTEKGIFNGSRTFSSSIGQRYLTESRGNTVINVNVENTETPEQMAQRIDRELFRLEERRYASHGVRYKKQIVR